MIWNASKLAGASCAILATTIITAAAGCTSKQAQVPADQQALAAPTRAADSDDHAAAPGKPGTGGPTAAVDLPLAPGEQRTLVVAGGCFWCVEAVFEELEGVGDVISGYAGGSADSAHYEAVSAGGTSHAEAVQIPYDAGVISYGTLLRVFFATHDPTSRDRQGPDVGAHYRSAIFYATPDEQRVARAYIEQLGASGHYTGPIVTTLEPLAGFFPAEEYHQDYMKNNSDNPYIQQNAQPKVDKLQTLFPELLEKKAP